MTRKVLQIGSPDGVTFAPTLMRELGLNQGDHVTLEVGKKEGGDVIKALLRVDEELVRWTKGFIEKYRPALEVLAKE